MEDDRGAAGVRGVAPHEPVEGGVGDVGVGGEAVEHREEERGVVVLRVGGEGALERDAGEAEVAPFEGDDGLGGELLRAGLGDVLPAAGPEKIEPGDVAAAKGAHGAVAERDAGGVGADNHEEKQEGGAAPERADIRCGEGAAKAARRRPERRAHEAEAAGLVPIQGGVAVGFERATRVAGALTGATRPVAPAPVNRLAQIPEDERGRDPIRIHQQAAAPRYPSAHLLHRLTSGRVGPPWRAVGADDGSAARPRRGGAHPCARTWRVRG